MLDRLASDTLSCDACMALDGKDGPSEEAGRSSRDEVEGGRRGQGTISTAMVEWTAGRSADAGNV